MSKRVTVIYGVGFPVRKISDDDLVKFFVKHLDTIEQLDNDAYIYFRDMEYLKSNKGVWIDFLDYNNQYTGEVGVVGLISDIMSFEEKIGFEYRQAPVVDFDDDVHYIVFPQRMPWDYIETELPLCREQIYEIMNSYIKELNLQVYVSDVEIIYM